MRFEDVHCECRLAYGLKGGIGAFRLWPLGNNETEPCLQQERYSDMERIESGMSGRANVISFGKYSVRMVKLSTSGLFASMSLGKLSPQLFYRLIAADDRWYARRVRKVIRVT